MQASRARLTTVTAVVPIRSLAALTRLADALPEDRRTTLMLRLALRTTETLREAGAAVVVVSADPDVREWASNQKIRVVDEPDPPDLDAAAASGIDTVRGPWLVVHADLPLITPDDVDAAAAALTSHGHVLAPSYDGGTNVIGGGWPTFRFSYGVGSFRRHLASMPTAKVLVRPGLALDLDRVRDLSALRNLRTP